MFRGEAMNLWRHESRAIVMSQILTHQKAHDKGAVRCFFRSGAVNVGRVKILCREAFREYGMGSSQERLGVPRSANRFALIEDLRADAVEAT